METPRAGQGRGVRSQRPVPAIKEIYAPINAPIIVTDINSAELIKHAANSFLALKISYINALAVLCEASGANVQEVANGVGMDARIGGVSWTLRSVLAEAASPRTSARLSRSPSRSATTFAS